LGDSRDFTDYQNSKMLRRAIEREFEIIGEAMTRILYKEPDINISNAFKIKGLRNHIIHAYDNVSNEILWGVIVKNLPELEKEIEILLKIDYLLDEEE
jgi:uncharacterized protein with HEPN domain